MKKVNNKLQSMAIRCNMTLVLFAFASSTLPQNAGAPGYHWQSIIPCVFASNPEQSGQLVRVLLDVAVYDATVAAGDTKYAYNPPRLFAHRSEIKSYTVNPERPSYPNSYIINGELKGAENAKVFLKETSYYKEQNAADATIADKWGKFIFRGKVQEATPCILTVEGKPQSRFFILENSKISIKGTVDSLGKAKIAGSKEEAMHQKLKDDSLETEAYNLLVTHFWAKTKGDTAVLRAIVAQKDSVAKKIQGFIFSHPASYASIELLKWLIHLDRIEEADGLLQRFKQTAKKDTEHLRFFENLIWTRKNLAVGKTAPDFTQPDTSGNFVDFSSFRGRYVLLDFWASWCPPCRIEHPNLLNTYKKYNQKNFTIVSISLDGEKDRWLEAIRKDGLPWTQLSDLKGMHNSVKELYGVMATPDNYLIDPNGKIIAKALYGVELDQRLEEILK